MQIKKNMTKPTKPKPVSRTKPGPLPMPADDKAKGVHISFPPPMRQFVKGKPNSSHYIQERVRADPEYQESFTQYKRVKIKEQLASLEEELREANETKT